jgi:hypothetical protein
VKVIQGRKKCTQKFGGKPLGKREIGITSTRLKDNIKIVFMKICCEDVNWILVYQELIQCRTSVSSG